MEKISLSELVPKISELSGGHSRATVRTILDAASEAIIEYAKNGQSVSLPGLGVFKPVDRAPRIGRNPHTGGEVKVPAKRVLAFKPSSKVNLNIF